MSKPALVAVDARVDPAECQSMAEVRQGVDALDRALVTLLAERQRYMHAAARIKPSRDVVHDDPLIGEEAKAQLVYYPTVTRERFETPGRITERIKSGDIFADLGLPIGFSPNTDRVMLCGSMAMIKETGELLETYGLKEGSNAEPGDYVLERAFVG